MTFVNPYTFVALRNGKTLFRDNDPEKLTGKIHCRLITKTQLCIPDLPEIDENGKYILNEYNMYRYPFYRIGSKPTIPGSSIRGVIRNVYEALTNSCMHINDKETDYFTSRYNKEFPGLIIKENGKYYIYEAERFRVFEDCNARTGDAVSFSLRVREQDDESEYDIAEEVATTTEKPELVYDYELQDGEICLGYYLRVNRFRSRNPHNRNEWTFSHPSVFVSRGEEGKEIGKVYIKRLKENVSRYNNSGQYDSKQKYCDAINLMEQGKTALPVWYSYKNGHYYLAPSKNSRAVYYNKPRDIIKNMGYQSCSDKSKICEACALFGFVDTRENGDSSGSRVRFSDAVCASENYSSGRCILPILGEPRLSSFEFYLRGIEPDERNAKIAGRKFYWHHINKTTVPFQTSSVDSMRPIGDETAIGRAEYAREHGDVTNFISKGCDHELLSAGTVFEFDVYFDGVTEKQLKKLVFSLNFGEKDLETGKRCHRLGHGKPIGLGSVKITADKIIIRKCFDSNAEKYLLSEFEEAKITEPASLFNAAEYEQVLEVAKLDAIPGDQSIIYPREEESEDIFKWFANNRDWRIRDGIAFYSVLPRIRDDNQKLRSHPPRHGRR